MTASVRVVCTAEPTLRVRAGGKRASGKVQGATHHAVKPRPPAKPPNNKTPRTIQPSQLRRGGHSAVMSWGSGGGMKLGLGLRSVSTTTGGAEGLGETPGGMRCGGPGGSKTGTWEGTEGASGSGRVVRERTGMGGRALSTGRGGGATRWPSM